LFLQRALEYLARVADREFIAKLNKARIFIGRDARAAPLDKFFFGELRALFKDDESLYLFAETIVRNTNYGDERNSRVRDDELFKLARIDVVAAAQDHIFLAVNDRQESILVHRADIAGVKPTVAKGLCRCLRA